MKAQLNLSVLLLSALFLILVSQGSFAQDNTGIKHGQGFVDVNGDGFNDNAPDHDKDGIPNGQDNDYTGPKQRGGKDGQARGFVDVNGDGINDRALDADGDGIPNGKDADFVRPKDGSGKKMGQGKGNGLKGGKGQGQGTGTGVCDGTGPKGKKK